MAFLITSFLNIHIRKYGDVNISPQRTQKALRKMNKDGIQRFKI